ncbi:LemA family protein [Candidatus Poseidoniaceae archaeon]|mgnify:FL=1|nr:LemA family protein [Euryarchaeota archaeon]MDA9166126.1 LemA family protein [Candidatus Poseidoniaceae archaeon]MDA8587876.1 LemA family protein [Euryarchaeota archaeon]MDA8594796.1 LemA family protein [Euryarchaeota archaeon]MDA8610417.1 LemA family protein [Euryarchaeota archaeon]
MSSALIIAGGVVGFFLLIGVIWFFSTWNRLVSLELNVDNSWAQISVLLKQRYDMIPNLVNIAKGIAKQEIAFFDKLFDARRAAAGALQSGNVEGAARAESTFAAMIPRINMVAEQYPELKSDSSFLNIQNQLVALENSIADRREFYNSSVTTFNKAIQMIPTVFVANVKGCERRSLFEIFDHERENVVIEF